MFDIIAGEIAGVLAIRPVVRRDARGFFVKTVHREFMTGAGVPSNFVEQYYSGSENNVLRGLHFQLPPFEHYKLVTCIEGEVFDVVVDLRRRSSTYGRHQAFNLAGDGADSVFIPSGCAHGFYVLSKRAVLLYNVSSAHVPTHDAGIRWDSAGIAWPATMPLLSERDAALPSLSMFETRF